MRSRIWPNHSVYHWKTGNSSVILYEYPFNERIRTYLRLEHLFLRLDELVARETPLDHHYALTTLFEIMDVATRADLKSDVLKDFHDMWPEKFSNKTNLSLIHISEPTRPY